MPPKKIRNKPNHSVSETDSNTGGGGKDDNKSKAGSENGDDPTVEEKRFRELKQKLDAEYASQDEQDRFYEWLAKSQAPLPKQNMDGDGEVPGTSVLDPKDPSFVTNYKNMIIKHEIVGAEVSEEVAEMVVDILSKGTDPKIIGEKKREWARPPNVPKLRVPQMNGELKEALKGQNFNIVKSNDDQISAVQELLVHNASAVMAVLDYSQEKVTKENKEDFSQVCTTLLDAVVFVIKAFGDLTRARRNVLVKDINPELKEVLGPENPATEEYIAGDNLPEMIKKLKEKARLSVQLKKETPKPKPPAGRGGGPIRFNAMGKPIGFHPYYSPGFGRGHGGGRGQGFNNNAPFYGGGRGGPRFPGGNNNNQGNQQNNSSNQQLQKKKN